MLRVLGRIAVWLVLMSAILSGVALAAGKTFHTSDGLVYFSTQKITQPQVVTTERFIFDPALLIRYNLTARRGIFSDPIPAPDSKQFAFITYVERAAEIRLFDFTTGKIHTIYHESIAFGATSKLSSVSWSPSGRYVVFRLADVLLKEDVQTGEVSRVVDARYGDGGDSYPSWSADERRIALAAPFREAGSGRIYLVNADGSNLQPIPHHDVCNFYTPYWSPRDAQIALDAHCDSGSSIFLYDADGGVLHEIKGLPSPAWSPVWSPDGSQIVFTAGTYPTSQLLYLVAADGSGLQQLVRGSFAFWSPDGTALLFTAPDKDLYTINVNGGDIRRLTFENGATLIFPLGWSP